jgi:hypothetical protein
MPDTTTLNPQPFGNVTVAVPGTPVQLCANLPGLGVMSSHKNPYTGLYDDPVPCNKFTIIASPITQAGAGNSGLIYIGTQNMVRATLAGVLFTVQPGQAWPVTNNVGMNTYQFQNLFMDSDNAGDGCFGNFDQE